jgi:RNA polymerase sigma factor (sigma-70 family)
LETQIFTDKELIENYLIGDESCLETLVRRHKKVVFVSIYQIVKDRQLADDLFQDTFIKVINLLKLGKYKEQGKFLKWVLQIARNIVMDFYRNSVKLPMHESRDDFDIFKTLSIHDANVEEKLIIDQIHLDVRKLIKILPEEQKEIVYLRHYKGMSYKEIALHTNVNVNTAIARMRYAIKNMRKIVKEKEIILTK